MNFHKLLYLVPALTASALGATLHAGERLSSAESTGFSWDTVPLYLHFGERTKDLTEAQLDFIAKNTSFVALEKSHGAAIHGSTEKGAAATARALKERNPDIKVLFYLNAFINWPGYEALKEFDPSWVLRDTKGEPVMKSDNVPRPDLSNPDMRAWWVDTVVSSVEGGNLDGVFADALPQILSPGIAKAVGPEKAKALLDGAREMLAATKKRLGPDKVIIANGTRGERYREILDWEGIDGIMIEHFDVLGSTAPEDLRADLETMRLASEKGKFTALKGWPGFLWMDSEKMKRPHAELLADARAKIGFPLACFLIGANEGDFFAYSWGYVSNHGMLEDYPELSRPLGPPKHDAVWDGLSATREFEHASVAVDLKAKTFRIDWR